MKTIYAFYAAHRYWPQEERLMSVYQEISSYFSGDFECVLFWDDRPLDSGPAGECLVVVPLSGAVQRMILNDAAKYESVILYAAYIRGNASRTACEDMLRANAAPTVMDTWAVMHRNHRNASIALNMEELERKLRVAEAYRYVKGAAILKIGETEPWVVSNAAQPSVYESRLGVRIVPVAQDEVVRRYKNATDEDGKKYLDWFCSHSSKVMEPTQEDIRNASRMAFALVSLMEDYNASGAAIACFNLLQTGTNMCLGVSYINDCTDRFISCECDMDSAVTMLMMKKLSRYKLWMANPGLQPDKTVNFSHCTAPICIMNEALNTTLRNHHESGIGVSLQVDIPAGVRVTACRLSDECRSITVQNGVTIDGPYESACRTQAHVRLDNFDYYLKTAMGCHQVFAFEDISAEMRELAEMLGLKAV